VYKIIILTKLHIFFESLLLYNIFRPYSTCRSQLRSSYGRHDVTGQEIEKYVFWDGLQCRNVHDKFRENWSTGSKVETKKTELLHEAKSPAP